MKYLILLITGLSFCKPSSVPADVEAGVQISNGVCELIAGQNNNVCATIDEIAQVIIPYILTLRPEDAGTSGPCTFIPKTTFCATNKEIDKSILFLVKARTAKLMLDGGK